MCVIEKTEITTLPIFLIPSWETGSYDNSDTHQGYRQSTSVVNC